MEIFVSLFSSLAFGRFYLLFIFFPTSCVVCIALPTTLAVVPTQGFYFAFALFFLLFVFASSWFFCYLFLKVHVLGYFVFWFWLFWFFVFFCFLHYLSIIFIVCLFNHFDDGSVFLLLPVFNLCFYACLYFTCETFSLCMSMFRCFVFGFSL